MKLSDTKLSNKIIKWTRIIHRDLGYLMVGVCIVYAISGIYLNHMNGQDPAYRTETGNFRLTPELDHGALEQQWSETKGLPELRKITTIDDHNYRLMLNGGLGTYNKTTGDTSYEVYTKRQFVYWINKLHYNKVEGWSFMADFFAVALIFFALSGLIMIKGKKGIAGRGKWLLLAGLLIPVIYILLAGK